MNWDKQVDQLIQQGIDDGVFSGATVLISNEGKIAYEQSFGYAVQYANAGKKRSLFPGICILNRISERLFICDFPLIADQYGCPRKHSVIYSLLDQLIHLFIPIH